MLFGTLNNPDAATWLSHEEIVRYGLLQHVCRSDPYNRSVTDGTWLKCLSTLIRKKQMDTMIVNVHINPYEKDRSWMFSTNHPFAVFDLHMFHIDDPVFYHFPQYPYTVVFEETKFNHSCSGPLNAVFLSFVSCFSRAEFL